MLVSDLDPLSPSLFAADAVVALPPVSDTGYGAAVADACRSEGARAVLPLTDLDPVLLARAAPAIAEAGARVFLPSPEVALGCQDKWECHLMLERAGLPSPPTWLPADADPARAALPGAGEAAARVRGAPHLPLRRRATSSPSSCATRRRRA